MPLLAQTHVDIPTKDILSWSFDDLKYDPNKPIYIDSANTKRSLSANQAQALLRKLCAGLRKAGLQKGDTVCVASFNDILYSILFLGILGSGGVFTGTNPGYMPREIEHHVNASKTKFIITEPDLLHTFLEAKHDVPRERIFIFNPLGQAIPDGFQSWETLLSHGEEDWVRFNDLETCRTTTAALLFSSGTTGLPKATMISHYNLISEHTLTYEVVHKPYLPRRLFALPMFHAATVPVGHTTPYRSGQPCVIMRRFDADGYIRLIEELEITDIMVMGPHIVAILMSTLDKKRMFRSVKHALCGGTPLDKTLQARLQEVLPKGSPFTQLFGMTESTCIAIHTPYPGEDTEGSVGFPLPNLDIKIIDNDGKDVTMTGERGELCLRGPTITRGYFENPAANKREWDEDGFFKSGDIAYRDTQTGKLFIVDRKKELIKVRGFQVTPAELEAVLLSHAHIVEAAVVGIPGRAVDGELPRAYLVRRQTDSGNKLTEAEVQQWFRSQVIRYKWLEGGVRFLDAMPKTGSGKILKRVLREMASKELGLDEKARL